MPLNYLSHEENTLVFFPRFLSLAVTLVPVEQVRCKRNRKNKNNPHKISTQFLSVSRQACNFLYYALIQSSHKKV